MITEKQWSEIKANLSNVFGHVEIEVGGVGSLSLIVERTRPLQYAIMSYVNGQFRGSWMNAETECPERDICGRRIERRVFPSKQRKILKRIKGSDLYKKTIVMYTPLWPTPGGLIRHLRKVAATRECRVIRIGHEVVNTPKIIDPPEPAAAA